MLAASSNYRVVAPLPTLMQVNSKRPDTLGYSFGG